MKFKHLLLVFLSSLILSFVLYGNTIKGDFVYDDSFFSKRVELRDPGHLGKIWFESLRPEDLRAEVYRPLTTTTFSLNYILFGESPVSFHLFNIVLHAFSVFFVYLVTLQLFKDKLLAFLTTLIFAFLPIHVEAVANIKSRDDVMYALFSLISTFIFLKGIEKEKISFKLILLSSAFFLLACFAKEFAITLPVLFFGLYFVFRKPNLKEVVGLSFILGVADLAYLVLRYSVLGRYSFGGEDPFWYYASLYNLPVVERVFTSFKLLFLYVQKTFVPYNLSATHHFNHLTTVTNIFSSPEAILGLIILLVSLFAVFSKKLRATPVGVGLIFFFSSYFIFSKFLIPSGENFAERWMYFPSFGISLILGYLISLLFKLKKKKYIAVCFLILITIFYGALLINRNKVWLNEKALYESMIKDAPTSAQGYIGLTYVYFGQGDLRKTEHYLKKGQEIYHDHPRLLNIEAATNLSKKNYVEAEKAIRRSVELLPTPISYMMQAIVLSEEGRYEESFLIIKEYMKSPFYSDSRNSSMNRIADYFAAVNLTSLGRGSEAKIYFDFENPPKGEINLLSP